MGSCSYYAFEFTSQIFCNFYLTLALFWECVAKNRKFFLEVCMVKQNPRSNFIDFKQKVRK